MLGVYFSNMTFYILQELEKKRDGEVEMIINFVNDPKVQKGLEMYLESLKKK